MRLPVMPPVSPMLAKSVASIPPDASYEPKWDGFRSICFRDGDEVELGSRNERPMTRYFPELVAAVKAELPRALRHRRRDHHRHGPRSGLRGAATAHPPGRLTCADAGREDPGVVHRVRPARPRRRGLHAEPFSERRAALVDALADSGPSIHVTPATTDLPTAQRWFDEFEGAGLDGVIAKPLTITYQPDKRVMFKIKHRAHRRLRGGRVPGAQVR